MTMCQITMKIPNEVLLDIHMNDREANAYAKQVFALWLYTKNKVSIGYCAEIAEMPEYEFIRFLGTQGISAFRHDGEEEFLKDVANA